MNLQRGLIAAVAVAALALAAGLPACADPPPAPWLTRDIGSPGRTGSTDVDASGVWTITGSGGIWGETDGFRFAYQPVKGDVSLTARFLSMAGGDGQVARVGLMARAEESPGSPNLFYYMSPQLGRGLSSSSRGEPAGATSCLCEVGPSRRREPDLLMRLQRAGSELAGFYSRDGLLWAQADFGPLTLPSLPETALFGLAATSFSDRTVTMGRFDQVDLQPRASSVYGLRGCGADGAALLQWRRLPNAVAYNIYRGPAGATPEQLVKLNTDRVAETSFTDRSAGLVNGTPMTYAVAGLFPGSDSQLVEGPRVAISATPINVPARWMGCSINAGPNGGSAVYDSATGEVTLRGSGYDYDRDFQVWMNNSEGYFLSQLLEGDGEITTRVLAAPARIQWARAGLLISESLDGGARSMFIGPTAGAGLVSRWRLTPNGPSDGAVPLDKSDLKLPITLRLTRRGDTIRAEYSTGEGQPFQVVDQYAFAPPLPRTVHVGLIVTADNRSEISEARFTLPQIRKL